MNKVWVFLFTALAGSNLMAKTLHVDLNSTNSIAPYSSRETAATDIQTAVNAAVAGDTVQVWDGHYLLASQISVSKAITIQSVNGPDTTIVDGQGSVRGFNLGNIACVIEGLTITNGFSTGDGGGIYCSGTTPVVTNCTISGNLASDGGGMAYGTANHCTISGNSANSGGGMYYGTAKNCIVYFNTSPTGNDLYDTTASYSCSPDVTHGVDGNITNAPMLVSSSHIADDSPCRGAGSVEYTTGTDIDGEAWANRPSMGCDEPSDDLLRGPIAVDFVANESMVASGYPIRFWEQIHGALSKHVWDFGDGTRVANSPSVEHAWASPGTFEVVLTAYNADWPGGVSATQEVSILSIEESAIHVSPDGNDSNDGTSWASAKKTIQAGVDAQNFLGGGVLLGSGSYSLTNEIVVDKQVRIIGVDGPDSTKVDGQRQVRCFNLGGSACVVEGLTITNGYSSGSGGGIYCSGTSIVTNCTITGNSAGSGGGMSGGTANNCTITGNSAGSGGGMRGGTANNCTITGNTASQYGGGMCYGTVNNCTITGNSAGLGGGISGVLANNCTISGNSAGYSGGGVNYGIVNNCTIIGNTAEVGGGMYDGMANNCTISDNTATEEGGGKLGGTANNCTISGNSAEYGGGMRGGTANNCVISGNSAEYGGGISYCTANNCILSGNTAFFYGGGMDYCAANSCTISGNSASDYGGGMGGGTANNCIVWYNTSPSGKDLYNTTARYSCSPDVTHGVNGNITNAPMFVNAANGNYRLAAGSPCIDAGSNGYVVGSFDMAGLPRILGGVVDMGAYEYYNEDDDEDDDGMPNWWEATHFGSIFGSAPADDYDNDLFDNISEWIAGSDPSDPTSVFAASVSTNQVPNGFVIEWTSVEDRTYSVLWGRTLTNAYDVLQDAIEYPQNSYTDTVHGAESTGFYQIEVQLK